MEEKSSNNTSLIPWSKSELTTINNIFTITKKIFFERAEYYFNQGFVCLNKPTLNSITENFSECIKRNSNYPLENNYKSKSDNRYNNINAIKWFSRSLELWPQYAIAYLYRGIANYNLAEYASAIADYSKTIEFEPSYSKAYFTRAIAKMRLKNEKDLPGAIADFSKAIEIKPNYLCAYFYRGIAKYTLSDYSGAIADFSKAIEIEANNSSIHNNSDFKDSTWKSWPENAYYFGVIDLEPCNSRVYFTRGYTKYYIKDYTGAMADFSKVIELDPICFWPYLLRGKIKAVLTDYTGAMADFSKAIEIAPRNSWAYYRRGNARNKLKDYAGAIADFNKALQIDPSNPDYLSSYISAKNRVANKNSETKI